MAWIGRSHGRFRLHQSDRHCGSYLSVTDAAEILDVSADALAAYAKPDDDGALWVSELDLHRRWGAGDIPSPHPSKVGAASRSFDELVLECLIKLTLPQAEVRIQVPFGRKRLDLVVTYGGDTKGIEYLGPSHFIRQYRRDLESPLVRKQEAEDCLGHECVLWPYWIQRCATNVRALFDPAIPGLASVWSTKAHFGDFELHQSASIVHAITERFRAFRDGGIGYMYLSDHTEKPVHPIVDRIATGKDSISRLVPRSNFLDVGFWVPRTLDTESVAPGFPGTGGEVRVSRAHTKFCID